MPCRRSYLFQLSAGTLLLLWDSMGFKQCTSGRRNLPLPGNKDPGVITTLSVCSDTAGCLSLLCAGVCNLPCPDTYISTHWRSMEEAALKYQRFQDAADATGISSLCQITFSLPNRLGISAQPTRPCSRPSPCSRTQWQASFPE